MAGKSTDLVDFNLWVVRGFQKNFDPFTAGTSCVTVPATAKRPEITFTCLQPVGLVGNLNSPSGEMSRSSIMTAAGRTGTSFRRTTYPTPLA